MEDVEELHTDQCGEQPTCPNPKAIALNIVIKVDKKKQNEEPCETQPVKKCRPKEKEGGKCCSKPKKKGCCSHGGLTTPPPIPNSQMLPCGCLVVYDNPCCSKTEPTPPLMNTTTNAGVQCCDNKRQLERCTKGKRHGACQSTGCQTSDQYRPLTKHRGKPKCTTNSSSCQTMATCIPRTKERMEMERAQTNDRSIQAFQSTRLAPSSSKQAIHGHNMHSSKVHVTTVPSHHKIPSQKQSEVVIAPQKSRSHVAATAAPSSKAEPLPSKQRSEMVTVAPHKTQSHVPAPSEKHIQEVYVAKAPSSVEPVSKVPFKQPSARPPEKFSEPPATKVPSRQPSAQPIAESSEPKPPPPEIVEESVEDPPQEIVEEPAEVPPQDDEDGPANEEPENKASEALIPKTPEKSKTVISTQSKMSTKSSHRQMSKLPSIQENLDTSFEDTTGSPPPELTNEDDEPPEDEEGVCPFEGEEEDMQEDDAGDGCDEEEESLWGWKTWDKFVSYLNGEPIPNPCFPSCGENEALVECGDEEEDCYEYDEGGCGGCLGQCKEETSEDTYILLIALPLVFLSLMASFKGC